MEMTAKSVLNAIEHEVRALCETVREYESDTFSSSDLKVTNMEIADIVSAILNARIRSMSDTLDGVTLSEELDNVRA